MRAPVEFRARDFAERMIARASARVAKEGRVVASGVDLCLELREEDTASVLREMGLCTHCAHDTDAHLPGCPNAEEKRARAD